MGCAASRLDNEDTVRRCKDRRRLMKEAVQSRHHLAAAHSDYLRSLRLTGATLSHFASFQSLSVSNHTPPVLLRPPPPSSASTTATPATPTPRPPPPPPPFFPPAVPPSPTIASSKLPHILSESSPTKSTPSQKPPHFRKYPHLPTNSTFATTPSQTSSVWNWENFYPPSPPDSEFFDRLKEQRENHHLPEEEEEEEQEESEEEREEVQCRDWGDQYSTTTSSSTKSQGADEEEDESRSEGIAARSDYASSSVDRHLGRPPPTSEFGSSPGKSFRKGGSVAESYVGPEEVGADLKMVVRHRDLKEIVAGIEELFVKAAAAGESASSLLETGRAQLDSSFRQLKKTVYHSSSVLSHLSSSLTSKPPLAIRYRLDTGSLVDSGGRKSHCSTMEQLLAWEKKLYDEVKDREGVKIEHEKKLSSLQSQEYKGKQDAKLDKTKTSIKKLLSLIEVTSQAVSTTSSAITRVRDNELAPQLVELCYGFMLMWRSMNQSHEIQSHIVQQVRGLVNHSSAIESTSEPHRQATRDLECAVSAWHSSFTRIVKFQRDYIQALYGWLKLTLFPVSNDDTERDHYSTLVSEELSAFLDEWKLALDRLPDTVASEAIKSFVNVVHTISSKQTEELKIKKRVESYSKELEKKSLALRSIEKKFYQSYSMVGIGLPDGGRDSNGQVFDTRDPLVEKRSKIAACRRKVEDEMMRHTNAIKVTREMTLNNIQTGLPGVFQAMTGFSGLAVEALEGVCRRAGSHN